MGSIVGLQRCVTAEPDDSRFGTCKLKMLNTFGKKIWECVWEKAEIRPEHKQHKQNPINFGMLQSAGYNCKLSNSLNS